MVYKDAGTANYWDLAIGKFEDQPPEIVSTQIAAINEWGSNHA
jgi:hypothetical protein